MTTIAAAVTRAGVAAPALETLELEDPRPNEILVRIVASGVCHTDLQAQQGIGLPVPRPVVLGHEGAGVVERVGSAVRRLHPGDHVLLSGSACGECEACVQHLPGYCVEGPRRIFAAQRSDGSLALRLGDEPIHSHFFGQSSFATRVLADERSAVRVDDDLPLEVLAPLGCGVITGAGCVLTAFGSRVGQTLAVFGTGGVGLSAVMAACLAGASTIIAIDVNRERLALALELGATHAFAPDDGDVVAAIRAITGRGVDFTLNTTHTPAVFSQALEALKPRGTAGFVSGPAGPWAPDIYPMLGGGKILRGIIGGDADPHLLIPILIQAYRAGRFPLDRLIKTYPFHAIADAFADAGAGRTIKPVLLMPEE